MLKYFTVSNPLSVIEENKKCIIDHKIVHKENQQLDGPRSQSMDVVNIIKFIEGVPYILNIKIKPKDKIYVLKLSFNPLT
jgi:hypothetical protein